MGTWGGPFLESEPFDVTIKPKQGLKLKRFANGSRTWIPNGAVVLMSLRRPAVHKLL